MKDGREAWKPAPLQEVFAVYLYLAPICEMLNPRSTVVFLRWLTTTSVLAASIMMWIILATITIHTQTELEKGMDVTDALLENVRTSFGPRVAIDAGFVILCACSYVVAFGQQSTVPLVNDCSFSGSDEIVWIFCQYGAGSRTVTALVHNSLSLWSQGFPWMYCSAMIVLGRAT